MPSVPIPIPSPPSPSSPDIQLQNVRTHARPEQSTSASPCRFQSSAHPSLTLQFQSASVNRVHQEFSLTPQPNISRNNLQIFWCSKFGGQLARPVEDLRFELRVPFVAPIIILTTAAQNHAAAKGAREDVGGGRINALWRAIIPVIVSLYTDVFESRKRNN